MIVTIAILCISSAAVLQILIQTSRYRKWRRRMQIAVIVLGSTSAILAVIAGIDPGGTPGGLADKNQMKAILEEVYRSDADSSRILTDFNEFERRNFTSSLFQRYLRARENDVIDFNIYFFTSDVTIWKIGEPRIGSDQLARVSVAAFSPTTREAPSEDYDQVYIFRKENGTWKIDDIIYPNIEGQRLILSSYLDLATP